MKSSSQTHAAGDHSRSASDQYSVPAAPNFTMQPMHMSAVRRCGGVVEEERLSPSQYRYLAHVGVSQHRAGMQVHHAAVSVSPCCCEDGYNCASDRGCCRSSWNLLLLRNPRPFLGEALMSRCCGRHAMMGAIGCAGLGATWRCRPLIIGLVDVVKGGSFDVANERFSSRRHGHPTTRGRHPTTRGRQRGRKPNVS